MHPDSRVQIIPCGFIASHQGSTKLYVHPSCYKDIPIFEQMLKSDTIIYIAPFFPLEDLKGYYDALQKDDNRSVSDISEVSSSDGIRMFYSFEYKIGDFDSSKLCGPHLNKVLQTCRNKLEKMNISGVFLNNTSSLLVFMILRRAYKLNPLYPRAIEYELPGSKLTPDGFMVIKGIPILIEVKTKQCGNSQVKRYMETIASIRPCIGIAMNYFGYNVFYTDGVGEKVLITVATICADVFKYLSEQGSRFLPAHCWEKYTPHSKTYPPSGDLDG
jgi:hypothetical protein